MELTLAENVLIDKVTIDLSEHFPEEDAKQYIKLRAMNVKEMLPFTRHQAALAGADADPNAVEAVTEYFIQILPNLIIEHSFTASGQPAPNQAVVTMLSGNQALFMQIMRTYVAAQRFGQGTSTD
jgi:hypothetical protein